MNNDTRNVFFNRNYRLVFFGALVSELGAILYSFAVSFYILEITDNNAFLQGLYLALCGGMLLLATPVGGVLGDRFNKAKIMYICDFCKGANIILATVLMLLFPEADAHIVILFALGITGNIISGIFNPAAGALLPQIVEPDQLQQGNSYFTIKSAVESILGVVLAGILYAALPVHTLLITALGINILDNQDLEALAETAAKLKRWEFMITINPMPVTGGTGSPMNTLAVF
jgi:Na+/melibiose symporter-like transporter